MDDSTGPAGAGINCESSGAGGLVARAGPDGQGRVLGEARIAFGLSAVEENGAPVVAVLLAVPAARAETFAGRAGFLEGIHVRQVYHEAYDVSRGVLRAHGGRGQSAPRRREQRVRPCRARGHRPAAGAPMA